MCDSVENFRNFQMLDEVELQKVAEEMGTLGKERMRVTASEMRMNGTKNCFVNPELLREDVGAWPAQEPTQFGDYVNTIIDQPSDFGTRVNRSLDASQMKLVTLVDFRKKKARFRRNQMRQTQHTAHEAKTRWREFSYELLEKDYKKKFTGPVRVFDEHMGQYRFLRPNESADINADIIPM